MGDPAGVGPLIAWNAFDARSQAHRPFYLVGGADVMRSLAPTGARLIEISDPSEVHDVWPHALPVLDIPCPVPAPGHPDPATAPAIINSIRTAVTHVQEGRAAAVVTNPISKALLYQAGFPHPGHTEFLAELAAGPGPALRPVMMLCGGGLKVALTTIHKPLVSVPGALSAALIIETTRITHKALQVDFGLNAPRIGLCGLNPHAGENGAIGREEIEMINPAAAHLRAEGVDISDARPSDVIFHEARDGRFDAVIALYHDQGLIPVKTLDLWGGVNTTLGLPFIRTSPDHGVAYDAVRDGRVRPDSLMAALALAHEMACARAARLR
jgi:4-hydroxythreonine-4-phosphate dehydrogenase